MNSSRNPVVHLVILTLLVLQAVGLAGCAALPAASAAMQTVATGAATGADSSKAALGQGAGGLSLKPSDGDAVGSVKAGTGKSSNTSSLTDVKQSEAVSGGKKALPLSTFEGDLLCSRLVAPFDLQSNVDVLMDTLGKSSIETLGTWLGHLGTNMLKAEADNLRYKIPYEMRAAAVRLNWLPMRAERLYGRMMLERMTDVIDPENRAGKPLYAKANKILEDLVRGIDEPHDYTFEIHVRSEGGANAMALPGGIVVVESGLLGGNDLNKAYFAIAHEIAHVLQRHETRAVQARVIDTVALAGNLPELTRQMNLMNGDPKAIFGTVIAGKLQFERHAEVQELHSDGCALRVLKGGLKDERKVLEAVGGFTSGLKMTAAVHGPKAADAKLSGADKLKDQMEVVGSLVDVVTRPIDRHPTGEERMKFLKTAIDNLRGLLASKVPAKPGKALEKLPPLPIPKKKTT